MKNMIKSIVASVAMTLCASVGLASTNITFCVGETAEFTYSGSGTPSVMPGKSTPNWETNITVTIASGKVTFQGKLDTTNEVTITLAMNGATKGPGMPSDNKYIFNVKTVEIDKTIMAWNSEAAREVGNPNYDPENKSNSTIRVVTHILKGNITTRDPNVLFLGTLCGRHSLTNGTVVQSLNAASANGAVDYYLYGDDDKKTRIGSLKKGELIPAGTSFGVYDNDYTGNAGDPDSHGHHYALARTLTKLYEIATSETLSNKYDYVIIEFDGTRMAEGYGVLPTGTDDYKKQGFINEVTTAAAADPLEKVVANWLLPFYEKTNVVWALDNGFDWSKTEVNDPNKQLKNDYLTRAKAASGATLDFEKLCVYGARADEDVWSSSVSTYVSNRLYKVNSGYLKNSGGNNQNMQLLDENAWNGLTTLLDPKLRLGKTTRTEYTNLSLLKSNSSTVTGDQTIWVGQSFENQVWYDDADKLGKFISTMIKAIPFNAVIADSVVQTYDMFDDMGLSLDTNATKTVYDAVRFYEVDLGRWTPGSGVKLGADSNVWNQLDKEHYKVESMTVKAKVNDITSEWWNKIEVDIKDDGTFFAKCLKSGRYEYNEATGEYLLNPNKDEATIELYDDTGKLLTKRSGAVDPTQQWEFEPRNMLVEYGDTEKTYDGIATNIWLKSGPFDAEYTSSNITKICVFSNSFDGVNWKSEEDFQKDWLVNATPASNVIWKVSALGYNTVQGTNTVTINKRLVVVESGDEDKTYDGVAATNWTAEVTSELDFIDKDKDKVSYKYDGTQTDAGESPNAFNVVFKDPVIAQNYNVTLVTGTLNVARAPILVVADDAEKKYGEDDPDPFTWSLDPDESEIAKGETNKVYVALSNVVELARCSLKGDFEDLEEDVDTYVGVITTNKPFAVYTTGVLKNYDLSFLKGDFEITPDKLIYIPPERDEHTPPEAEIKAGNATPYDYIGIYDGEKHTIRFKVLPTEDDNDEPRVTQVRFSEDGEEWTKWEDYSATGDYKNIPTVKDCDTKVPVYVQALNEPNYPDITNLVAYVTITQRTVIVAAKSNSKPYDGKPLTGSGYSCWGDFVGDEGIKSLEMTKDSTITNVGNTNNVIDVASIKYKTGTNPDNYIFKYVNGKLFVTPMYVTVCPKAGKKCEGDKDPVIGYRVYVGRPGGLGDEITTKMPKAEAGEYKYDDGGTGAVGSYEIVKSVDYSFGGNYKVETVATDKDGKKVKFTIEQCKCMELTCVSVHRVKLSGKACVAKTLAADKKTKATCEDSCWLKPGSFRIAGYFYGASDEELEECESCACQETFVGPYYHFWDASKKQVVFTPAGIAFDILRNGGDKKKAQTCFTLSQEKGVLYCAGFGEMSYKTYAGGLLKGASGFFAGTIDAPKCSSYNEETCEESTATAKAFLPCALTETEPELAIAYGRWNVAYKSEMVKKVEAEGSWDCLYPTGYQEADGN